MELLAVEPRSAEPATQAKGRYLYAITDASPDFSALSITGMDDGSVYGIEQDGIVAVVSDIAPKRLRPERRRMAAHHNVLRLLLLDHTVLPMAFGVIADGPEAIRRILRLNRDAFAHELDRFRDKVEMGLRVTWDVPNIFEHVVATHPELAAYRDQIFRGGREPAHEEKIDLGRTFDRLLNADRDDCIDKVTRALEPRCVEIKLNSPRDERDVMNLACLVDRARIKEFEAGVIDAARRFNNDFAFDFNGPWPPHNFVEMALKMP